MTHGKVAKLFLIGAVVGLVAACGNGNSTTAEPATSITVGANEFAFDPSSVAVAAGQDVTVTLNNSGSIEHEWVILTAGTSISSEAEFDEFFGRIVDEGLVYGSEPWTPENMKINDWNGGRGVYFRDPSGHLLELLTRDYTAEQFAQT